MKDKKPEKVETSKVALMTVLSLISISIVFLGLYFSVYSVIGNVSFNVLNSQIHGVVFGLVTLFLGVRYFLSVQKLKAEVYKPTSRFSWSNFRKQKLCQSLKR